MVGEFSKLCGPADLCSYWCPSVVAPTSPGAAPYPGHDCASICVAAALANVSIHDLHGEKRDPIGVALAAQGRLIEADQSSGSTFTIEAP
jgi:hypothetical protein